MPYGPPLADDVPADDGFERGLVFVCSQASISRQFEAVQMQWLNDGNIFGLGHDRDFLLGGGGGGGGRADGDASGATGKMTIQGDPPCFLAPQEALVTTRGGEYLFVPGLRALAAIAGASTG